MPVVQCSRRDYKPGDEVFWVSQSAGVWKQKTGVIEAVIPAGQRPKVRACGQARDHESYTVRVKGKRGSRLYWPRVSKLAYVMPF